MNDEKMDDRRPGPRPSFTYDATSGEFSTTLILYVRCPNCQIAAPDPPPSFALNLLQQPMTSDQLVSVSPIWQLGHVEEGPDVFAEPP